MLWSDINTELLARRFTKVASSCVEVPTRVDGSLREWFCQPDSLAQVGGEGRTRYQQVGGSLDALVARFDFLGDIG